MPLINYVESSLSEATSPKLVDLVITDGDGTLFPHGSAEPFDGSCEYLEGLHAKHLAFVSANPDYDLALERAARIGADSISVPRVANWVKSGLFHDAINKAQERTEVASGAVLGNRWMMDVTLGRVALFKRGITDNYGVFVRLEPSLERFDKYVTGPIEAVGARVAKKTRLDEFIRPRRPRAM